MKRFDNHKKVKRFNNIYAQYSYGASYFTSAIVQEVLIIYRYGS